MDSSIIKLQIHTQYFKNQNNFIVKLKTPNETTPNVFRIWKIKSRFLFLESLMIFISSNKQIAWICAHMNNFFIFFALNMCCAFHNVRPSKAMHEKFMMKSFHQRAVTMIQMPVYLSITYTHDIWNMLHKHKHRLNEAHKYCFVKMRTRVWNVPTADMFTYLNFLMLICQLFYTQINIYKSSHLCVYLLAL